MTPQEDAAQTAAWSKQYDADQTAKAQQEAQAGQEPSFLQKWVTGPIGRVTMNALDSAVSAADSIYDTPGMEKARDVVAGGITGAVNTADAAVSFGRGVAKNFSDPMATGDLAEVGDPAAQARERSQQGPPSSPIWDHAKGAILDFRDAVAVQDPTLSDNLIQGAAQLALPFAGYSRALAGLHGIANWAAAGAITDSTALDPHAMRMADLIALGRHTEGKLGDALRTLAPNGSALNAYINYLTDRGNETEAEGRLKNVLDGFGVNLIATPLLHGAAVVLKQGMAGLRYAVENGIGSAGDIVGIKSPAAQRGAVGDLAPERRVTIRGNEAELPPELEAQFQRLIKQPGMQEKFQQLLNNAAGESPASQEAVNRVASEHEAGVSRWRIDPDGTRTPLIGVDAVDAKAPEGHIHTMRDAEGNEIITDRGGLPLAHARGLLTRAQTLGGATAVVASAGASAQTWPAGAQYDTPLHSEQEKTYKVWRGQMERTVGHDLSSDDYDLRGAFAAGVKPGENGHLTDEFKKPNHFTFSTDSKYSGHPYTGGTWTQTDGRWAFRASRDNMRFHSIPEMIAYFKRAEPDSTLYVPGSDKPAYAPKGKK